MRPEAVPDFGNRTLVRLNRPFVVPSVFMPMGVSSSVNRGTGVGETRSNERTRVKREQDMEKVVAVFTLAAAILGTLVATLVNSGAA
jgi:hypothetical protein